MTVANITIITNHNVKPGTALRLYRVPPYWIAIMDTSPLVVDTVKLLVP